MIEILMLALSRIMWNGTLAKGLVKEDTLKKSLYDFAYQ